LGAGSEFVVYLPLAATTVTPKEPQAPMSRPRLVESLRVVVVDDNVDTAESLAMLLTAVGHEVQTRYTGPDGLASGLAFDPDVVLLDIGLPGMDGYEVAATLRASPHGEGLTLVALTGYGQESDKQRALASGFDAHLVKPVDFGLLQALLTATVAQRSAARRKA
jgi:CheY-like chemotaxis protein